MPGLICKDCGFDKALCRCDKPSVLSELLGCPFCGSKATLISKEDSGWEKDMVTCKNQKCDLWDWIPYNDWQRRAT